jgi:hypothetical protein
MPRSFPDFFPDRCPPDDAIKANHIVFRFVKEDPPTPKDFVSHYQLGLAPKADLCERCSLSVFDSREAARLKLLELKERFPDRSFGNYLAECVITHEHGSIKQTGRDITHHSWWAFQGVNFLEVVRIVHPVA